jgi:ligand-binding sensor domain-containing protein
MPRYNRSVRPGRTATSALLLPALALLATVAGAATLEVRDLRFRHLDVEDGLSHSNVYSIAQDSTGFMWFAAEQGLNRYDGYGFEVIAHDPADPASLAEEDVNTVLVDHAGTLWVGTWGGGLNRYEPATESFVRYPCDPARPGALHDCRVQRLLEDRDGNLWVGTFAGGLARLDRASGTFTSFTHDPANPASISDDRVWSLAEDREGFLWVGTDHGLDRFDRATGSSVRYKPDPAQPLSLPS